MKRLEDIAKLLSNRINQEHYVLHYLKKVFNEGVKKGKSKDKFSKAELKEAFSDGLDTGYMEATRYVEPDNDVEFDEWFALNHETEKE